MKNKNIIYIVLMAVLAGFSACTDNFEEINTNPNDPLKVTPNLLLTQVIHKTATNYAELGFDEGAILAQYAAQYDFNSFDHYKIGSNNRLWEASYRNLRDLNQIIDLAKEQNNTSYEGVAYVLRAFNAALLTDLWNEVAYFEAGKAYVSKKFTTDYSSQEDIYTKENGIISSLEKAVLLLKDPKGSIDGDILFQGDIKRWIRLANSLQLRYLLRISDKTDVSAKLNALVSADLLEADAALPYLSQPNHWIVSQWRSGSINNLKATNTFLEITNPLKDARRSYYFSNKNEAGDFIGIIPGTSVDNKEAAILSSTMQAADIWKANLITLAEQNFILAEAKHRALISAEKTVEAYYNAGITASYASLGVEDASSYLEQENVKLQSGKELEQIITQKWIANTFVGYEGWLDYRRTGLPTLTPAINNENNNKIPVRYEYPSEESYLNKASYDAAVANMGGNNSINHKGFWDKK